jgi:hypothetical protein
MLCALKGRDLRELREIVPFQGAEFLCGAVTQGFALGHTITALRAAPRDNPAGRFCLKPSPLLAGSTFAQICRLADSLARHIGKIDTTERFEALMDGTSEIPGTPDFSRKSRVRALYLPFSSFGPSSTRNQSRIASLSRSTSSSAKTPQCAIAPLSMFSPVSTRLTAG